MSQPATIMQVFALGFVVIWGFVFTAIKLDHILAELRRTQAQGKE